MIENGGRVPEDEISVATDETFAEIHSRHRIGMQRVLVTDETNVVVDRLIGTRLHRQRRRDVLVRREILKGEVAGHETNGRRLNVSDRNPTEAVRGRTWFGTEHNPRLVG